MSESYPGVEHPHVHVAPYRPPLGSAVPLQPQLGSVPGASAGAAVLPAPPLQPTLVAQRGPHTAPRGAAERAAADAGGHADLVASALRAMLEAGASDLHLSVGSPPMARVAGVLRALDGFDVLEPDALRRSVYAVLTQRQREAFEDKLELDFAHTVPGVSRFRVNLYQQRASLGAVFRVIPHEIKPLDELGVPSTVARFATLPRGLVLVTGPTGSGKSTTLAAVVDLANRTRRDHIVTVEDPIEFLHQHKGCLVNQREVGSDTHSFASALKHALRQDPDIILVGELRDLETVSVALTAAETGHLVLATLHTQDAAQTIDRVIDVFPQEQHAQVRAQLAGAIQGIVCQTLCKTADGRGRAAATEVLVATPAIRNLIREGKTHQIYSAMQSGGEHGMQTLDQDLARLVTSGRITYEEGLERCHHLEDYTRLTGRPASRRSGITESLGSDGTTSDAFGTLAPLAGGTGAYGAVQA